MIYAVKTEKRTVKAFGTYNEALDYCTKNSGNGKNYTIKEIDF